MDSTKAAAVLYMRRAAAGGRSLGASRVLSFSRAHIPAGRCFLHNKIRKRADGGGGSNRNWKVASACWVKRRSHPEVMCGERRIGKEWLLVVQVTASLTLGPRRSASFNFEAIFLHLQKFVENDAFKLLLAHKIKGRFFNHEF
jgi:hypothetical protein